LAVPTTEAGGEGTAPGEAGAPAEEGATAEEGAPAVEQPVEEGAETPVETPTTVPDPTVEEPAVETNHTIAAGDTLFALSLRYGVSIEAIIAANGLANPDDLEVGQVLVIPPPGTEVVAEPEPTDPATEEPAPADPAAGTERVHVVQAGENLFRIGLQYGFSVEELTSYNGISNPDSLEVGQEIKIPPAE
jgi:LysM repeat protein